VNSRVRKKKDLGPSSPASSPKLYAELAPWWLFLLPPTKYSVEAELCRHILVEFEQPVRTLLELGSGGGNNAYHLKRHFQMTLVDRSPEMLAVSSALNPECEHFQDDIRTVRLARSFDAVLIHDAIMHMTSEDELALTLKTAFEHCTPGGIALFVPDYIRENFHPMTSHGGHDSDTRGARCLWWTWDPNPNDTVYELAMAYILRDDDGSVRFEGDRHQFGLFSRATWLQLLENAGFLPRPVVVGSKREVFVGKKSIGEVRS
jgi:SAM-dependent methyltransferase